MSFSSRRRPRRLHLGTPCAPRGTTRGPGSARGHGSMPGRWPRCHCSVRARRGFIPDDHDAKTAASSPHSGTDRDGPPCSRGHGERYVADLRLFSARSLLRGGSACLAPVPLSLLLLAIACCLVAAAQPPRRPAPAAPVSARATGDHVSPRSTSGRAPRSAARQGRIPPSTRSPHRSFAFRRSHDRIRPPGRHHALSGRAPQRLRACGHDGTPRGPAALLGPDKFARCRPHRRSGEGRAVGEEFISTRTRRRCRFRREGGLIAGNTLASVLAVSCLLLACAAPPQVRRGAVARTGNWPGAPRARWCA